MLGACGAERENDVAQHAHFRADSLRLVRAIDSVYDLQFEDANAAYRAWQPLADEARRLRIARPLFNYYKYATGNRLLFAADLPAATATARQAMHDAELSGDSLQLGIASFCYGMVYGYREISDTSSLYFIRAAELLKGGKDWGTLLDSWNNLAEMSRLQGDYENAEQYILEAHRSTATRNEPRQMANEFAMLFEVNNAMDRNRQAKLYLDSATQYFTQTNDLSSAQYATAKGSYFLKHGIADSAVAWFRRAYTARLESGDTISAAIATVALAEAWASTHDNDSVHHALLHAARLARPSALPPTARKTFFRLKLALPSAYITPAERAALSAASIELLEQMLANNQKLAGTQYRHSMEQVRKDNIILGKTLQSAQRGQWIWLLCGALLLLGITLGFVVHGYRKRQELQAGRILILAQERELELLAARMNTRLEERGRIGRELHDDLGSTLTSIAMATGLLKRRHPAEDSREVAIIADGAAGLVDRMNEIVWSLNTSNDTLQSLVAYIRRFAAGFLEEAGIALELHLPDVLPDLPVQDYARRNVFLTVKEAINNLVRHAGATKATLGIAIEGTTLCITIEDDGCGLPANTDHHAGNGLRNMQAGITAIGGTIRWSKPTRGTLVTIAIPLIA